MKMLGRWKILVSLMVLCLFQMQASAHTGLKTSAPADESTVATPPESIQLVFTAAVRLIKFELLGTGHTMPTEFVASTEPGTEFTIVTPGMHPGAFTVNWAAMGADGHTMTDSFTFTVAAPANSGAD